MKKRKDDCRESNFLISLFIVFFLSLLLLSGIHQGLIVLANERQWSEYVGVILAVLYWGCIASALTAFTLWRVRKTYEKPVKIMSEATTKVAGGDFSVYIPPQHSGDKLDYVDTMFMDFNKMVEELGSIETLKTDFFANVSHEIKTPLAAIQNSAELLQRDSCTEEQRKEHSENIIHASKRLSNLITNMLKLNKLDRQVIKPTPAPYDLCAQLCECAFQLEDMWERKDIEFIADIEDRAMICADEGLLQLIWTNLLSNAVKFTPNGGTITVTQSSDENGVTVCVSDTGCGMDEAMTKRIFEKFYQGDTSHATEGNGLGLALVQRIVQLSEGTISVQSTPGKGSAFTIWLPISMHQENERV